MLVVPGKMSADLSVVGRRRYFDEQISILTLTEVQHTRDKSNKNAWAGTTTCLTFPGFVHLEALRRLHLQIDTEQECRIRALVDRRPNPSLCLLGDVHRRSSPRGRCGASLPLVPRRFFSGWILHRPSTTASAPLFSTAACRSVQNRIPERTSGHP